MFVVYSSHWKASQARGQERLLFDLWIELVSDDATALYWPPLCSTLQLLRNLRQTLDDVQNVILKPYTLKDGAEELLSRLAECGWLVAHYPSDIEFLRERLQQLRDANYGEHDEGPSHKSTQEETRRSVSSLLRALIDKIERDGPIAKQVQHLSDLASSERNVGFDVMARATSELVNDLLHLGHARDYLHAWFTKTVVLDREDNPYLDRFAKIADLGRPIAGEFQIAFAVSVGANTPGTSSIRFSDEIPEAFVLSPDSALRTIRKSRFAIVSVTGVPDWRAAIEVGSRMLVRYLHSTRLDHLNFDRAVSGHAAAHHSLDKHTDETRGSRRLTERRLHNDEAFYGLVDGSCDRSTFAELDRVVYWLEQSKRWDDMGRFIALWTATEFLFSKTVKSAPQAIQDVLPSYLVPCYPRDLLRDLWAFVGYAKVRLPHEILDRLEWRPSTRGGAGRVNLEKLFALCIEEDATNPLKALIAEYPILLRKYYRVRRLNPRLRIASSGEPEIWKDLERFERNILFDVRFAYRVRNAVVHDAAMNVVQFERLIQRLMWMLCTSLDTLLYQFCRNPNLSLSDLHEINHRSYVRWRARLKDEASPVPLSEIINPPRYGLSP